jgi:hypothetical protein
MQFKKSRGVETPSIDLFHGRRRHCVAWENPRNPHMRIGWLVNEDNFERALSLDWPIRLKLYTKVGLVKIIAYT